MRVTQFAGRRLVHHEGKRVAATEEPNFLRKYEFVSNPPDATSDSATPRM